MDNKPSAHSYSGVELQLSMVESKRPNLRILRIHLNILSMLIIRFIEKFEEFEEFEEFEKLLMQNGNAELN